MAGQNETTIAALATAPAPSGVAIVRVSGPKSRQALERLFHSKRKPTANPRELVLGELVDHSTGDKIDKALAVFMPGPESYTGEDVGEFQFHGSPLVVKRLLRSLSDFGIHAAEAGEFTKRAFLNGKLDLIQAEAVCDLINATSDYALKLAGEQLEGRFSNALDKIGEPIRDALAELEASLDFPEEDIEPATIDSIRSKLKKVRGELKRYLSSYEYGHRVREGFRVLLCGKPNAGKSSLLNRLLDSDRAIVTEIAGTTRDLIEESITLGGFEFVFCDSAGLNDSPDVVENIGMQKTVERFQWADLILFIVDGTSEDEDWRTTLESYSVPSEKLWMLINKIDIAPNVIGTIQCESAICGKNFYLSAKSGKGLTQLTSALVDHMANLKSSLGEASVLITNQRQRSSLQQALNAMDNALSSFDQPLEIVCAELRSSLGALEELIGKTWTEDILGRIFSKFCIGK